LIGGWVSPRAVPDAVVKRKIPSPRRESNPRTPIVQSIAQRYTDRAITAERDLGISERMYSIIFGPMRKEEAGGWRKLHNEELHNL
jgi:hypothetical protein